MNKNYADVLESYLIAEEYYVSYYQKYDKDRKSTDKISLTDMNILVINAENCDEIGKKYRGLGLPLFNKRRFFKDGVTWVRILDANNRLVASAEIYDSRYAMKLNVSKYDTVPYDESKSFLNDLTVRKDYQGKGLGRQIFKYLVSKFNIGYLEVHVGGEVAENLYKSEGFRVYYRDDDIICMKK